jgi:hypothetical protein
MGILVKQNLTHLTQILKTKLKIGPSLLENATDLKNANALALVKTSF